MKKSELRKIIKEEIKNIIKEKKWTKNIDIEKGKMHKVLGIDLDKKISSKYTSGKKLAQDLINAVGRKKAAGMINFSANINSDENIFDKAQKALNKIPK